MLELRQAWEEPVSIKTPDFPNGRLCRLVLAAICADRPAAIAAIGAGSQTSLKDICTRCEATHQQQADTHGKCSQLQGRKMALNRTPTFLVFPFRNSHEHNLGVLRKADAGITAVLQARHEHNREQDLLVERNEYEREAWALAPRRGRGHKPPLYRPAKFTNSMMKTALEHAPYADATGHLTACMFLPYFDKFQNTVFDPMHNLLQGNNKTYFRKCLQLGQYLAVNEPLEESDASSRSNTDTEDELPPACRPVNEPVTGPTEGSIEEMTLERAMRDSQSAAIASSSTARTRPDNRPVIHQPRVRVGISTGSRALAKRGILTPANLVMIGEAIGHVSVADAGCLPTVN